MTTAGEMPASCVIHTVGPIYKNDTDKAATLLASCYIRSLQLAAARNLSSIAFPAISTGVFGYPLHEASIVASKSVQYILADSETLAEVRFVFRSLDDANVFLDNNAFQESALEDHRTGQTISSSFQR